MASLLQNFDVPVSQLSEKFTDDKDSESASRQKPDVPLGLKDANDEDVALHQACVRKTRTGGYETYVASANEFEMVCQYNSLHFFKISIGSILHMVLSRTAHNITVARHAASLSVCGTGDACVALTVRGRPI
jgi:hypothetical protein